jgi:Hemerythrin HHE cation binding domain
MASAARIIRQDHKKVAGLFKKFDQAKTGAAKKRVINRLAKALDVHAQLEEEIFYPAVRKQLGEEDLLEEAHKEHEEAKEIMTELEAMDGEDERLEPKFSELIECVQHHVEEEEGELLPMVEESTMDLALYGEQMTERKEDLAETLRAEKSQARPNRKSKTAHGRKGKRSAA